GTRRFRSLRVVDVRAIRRLKGYVPAVVRDLDGISAGRRDLPDLILSASVRAEVDPLAVPGEAGDVVVGRMGSDATRLAARSRDHIDLVLAFEVGVERNHLTVRRPAWGAGDLSAHGGELDGVGPVG